MPSVICTVFEGHYHLGTAALLNSLHRHGFKGDFVCGHRGPKPGWSAKTPQAFPGIRVHWLEITTRIHLTNHKPDFMLRCIHELNTPADARIYYMDPDLVIKAPWSVFERWASDGIALVEDLNASLPAGHPYRLAWHDLYRSRNRKPARRMDRYHNAGFVGLPCAQADFLRLWSEIISWAGEEGAALSTLKNAEPHDLFHTTDQDAMNMALELSEIPINAAGPEAMDFVPGGHLISHAAGGTKPWRGGFLRDALRGKPPGTPQKAFYDYVDAPLQVLPPALVRARRWQLRLASLIGRFYCRR